LPIKAFSGLSQPDFTFASLQKLLLYSLPILAIAGMAVTLALGQVNFSLMGSYLAVPMFFSALFYLKYRNGSSGHKELEGWMLFLSLNIFLLNFVISLFLLRTFNVRSFAYYAVITLMTALVLFNILFFKPDRRISIIVLLQCMALVLNIIWGVNLNYYFFIGRTDAIGHAYIIGDMLKQGHVTELFELYKPFPLWHILVSSLYTTTGIHIPVHRAMFFTSGLIYSFLIPLVYLVSLKIFNNQKLALLSSLFTVTYPDIIFFGMYSISRSIVSFLEVLLILLLLKRGRPETAVLYIIAIFSIILFHTASMPFIIAMFSAVWFLQKLLRIEKRELFITNYCLMLVISATLFYWMFLAEDLFRAITSSIFSPPPIGVMPDTSIDMPLNELFNYLQYSPLLFLSFVGILFSMRSKRISNGNRVLLLTGLLLIPVTFPGPSLLLNRLATTFNFARFSEYSFILILIANTLGFGYLFFRSGRYGKIFLVVLFILMSFLSLSNDFVASDNPLVKRPFYTFYLTDEEITSFYQIASKTEGYMMSDYVTSNFIFNSPYIMKEHILEVDSKNMTLLRNSSADTLLIRTGELEKRPLYLYSSQDGGLRLEPNLISSCKYYSNDIPLWRCLDRYNKVFESSIVQGYI
jgi:hypothetical protein